VAKKVLVIGEVREGKLRNVSLEAITVAALVADGGEVVGVLLGEDVIGLSDEFIRYGTDRVVVVSHDKLKDYTTDAYQQALIHVLNSEQPEAVILGHTSVGKDIAPRLAMRVNAGLVSDIVSDELLEGEPLFTRPIYSGKAFEKRKINRGAVFATIRPNNFTMPELDETRQGEVAIIDTPFENVRTIIRNIAVNVTGTIDLSEANVIVAGGRGVKSKEGFETLRELAGLLGGVVAASRGACDAN